MGLSVELFGKKLKDLTEEELKIYRKRMYEIKIQPKHTKYLTSKSYLTYGKRWRDMTADECRAVQRAMYRQGPNFKDKSEKSFAMKYFGKRCKDLTPEEKREYWRLRKAVYVERRKQGIKMGRGYYIEGE